MKLKRVKVTNFKSILDSTEVDIGSTTCLVGKNQSGKTAFLLALAGLNPYDTNLSYNAKSDYPRSNLNKFLSQHGNNDERVITTTWKLEEHEFNILRYEFGENFVGPEEIVISKAYSGKMNFKNISVDQRISLKHLYKFYDLTDEEIKKIKNPPTLSIAARRISNLELPTPPISNLLTHIESYPAYSASDKAIELLENQLPYFIYFNRYDRMSGKVSLQKLANDLQENSISPSDKIFVDLLRFADINMENLENYSEEELNSICESASNKITDKIFGYWTQNKHLEFHLKIHSGLPSERDPFNNGLIASARIFDRIRRCSLQFSEQSAGFIWFFSFLVKFAQFNGHEGGFIILLDEPGLTIHGTAQQDLLRYFSEVIVPQHQLIYTTHSPFMVPADNLSVVRTVENVEPIVEAGKGQIGGTRIYSNFHSVNNEYNLPILNAMGYTLTQGLLVKPNMLLVEGPSDSMYLEVFSRRLALQNKANLDSSWAICPAGGVDKIQSFVTLFCRSGLNIVVLCDYDESRPGKVDKLKKAVNENNLIDVNKILCVTEFVDQKAADIEDLFERKLYIELVNAAFRLENGRALKIEDIADQNCVEYRISKKIDEKFREFSAGFKHLDPARYLVLNPDFLDLSDHDLVLKTSERFERIFQKISEIK